MNLSGAPLKGRLQALPTNNTRLERLTMDKHYSLFRKFVNYGKKFYNIGPWYYYVRAPWYIVERKDGTPEIGGYFLFLNNIQCIERLVLEVLGRINIILLGILNPSII